MPFILGGFICLLQHAPYDAMVLVSLCWHLDQQIKATGGVWKVLMIVTCLKMEENVILNLSAHSLHISPRSGLRGSESAASS